MFIGRAFRVIRQDIGVWFKSRCGLILPDTHGSLYDSSVSWLVAV
jgi:hypothetical protein